LRGSWGALWDLPSTSTASRWNKRRNSGWSAAPKLVAPLPPVHRTKALLLEPLL